MIDERDMYSFIIPPRAILIISVNFGQPKRLRCKITLPSQRSQTPKCPSGSSKSMSGPLDYCSTAHHPLPLTLPLPLFPRLKPFQGFLFSSSPFCSPIFSISSILIFDLAYVSTYKSYHKHTRQNIRWACFSSSSAGLRHLRRFLSSCEAQSSWWISRGDVPVSFDVLF